MIWHVESSLVLFSDHFHGTVPVSLAFRDYISRDDLLPDLNVSSSKVSFGEYVHRSMAMAARLQVWLSEPGLRLSVCHCFVTTSDSLLVHPKRRCGGCLK